MRGLDALRSRLRGLFLCALGRLGGLGGIGLVRSGVLRLELAVRAALAGGLRLGRLGGGLVALRFGGWRGFGGGLRLRRVLRPQLGHGGADVVLDGRRLFESHVSSFGLKKTTAALVLALMPPIALKA